MARQTGFSLRQDLEWQRRAIDGACWLVRDPLTLQFSRFDEEEKWILEQIDRGRNTQEIQAQFAQVFAPQTLDAQDVQAFISRCWQQGFLIANRVEQCDMIRNVQQQKEKSKYGLQQALAIQVPLFNPSRLLAIAQSVLSPLFSTGFFVLWLVLGALSLLMVAVRSDVLVHQLVNTDVFLARENWLNLWLVFVATKCIHEFGHGIACLRYGGRCHEMGFYLFFFTPCLYCDVTDSWRFSNRWQRLVVAAGGVYLESWLAILASFFWWNASSETTLSLLCLNVMVVCSISTLLVNLNPLLKFDGYFILADALDIPNLRQRSFDCLKRCCGLKRESIEVSWRRFFFYLSYALAALAYRISMLAAIVWGAVVLFENSGLGSLGMFVGAVFIITLLSGVLLAMLRTSFLGQLQILARLAVAVGLAYFVLTFPMPYHVRCELEVVPAEQSTVFVGETGELIEVYVENGAHVHRGQPLLRLENRAITEEKQVLEEQLDQLNIQRQAVLNRALNDPSLLESVETIDSTRATVRQQIHGLADRQERLLVLAPQAGTLFLKRRPGTEDNNDQLASWSETPLSENNLGAVLERGLEVAAIGVRKRQLWIQVPERFMADITADLHARCLIQGQGTTPLDARIITVTRANGMSGSPSRTTERTFIAVAEASSQKDLLVGARGTAKLRLGSKSIAERIMESLRSQWRDQLVVAGR